MSETLQNLLLGFAVGGVTGLVIATVVWVRVLNTLRQKIVNLEIRALHGK